MVDFAEKNICLNMSQIQDFEVEEFKKLVHKWLSIDDDIRKLQAAGKELKKQKDELTPEIMEFMNKNNIEDCNTNNGKLKYKTSLHKKPMNRQFIVEKLGVVLNNKGRGEELTQYLFDNREVETKMRLSRTFSKKSE